MKNKAIEQLVRRQYNIPDDEYVEVEFIASVGFDYEFRVTTYFEDGAGRTMKRETKIKISAFNVVTRLD